MGAYSNKTVLVTGATGLIGSHIVDELMRQEDVKVIALSRSISKLKSGFAEYLNESNFSIVDQDIINPFTFKETVDYIFHAAGPMEGKVIRERPMDVINPNLNGTLNCLEFLKKQEKDKGVRGRLILFSSITVYGNNTGDERNVEEKDTDVTEVLDAISAPYSQSKRMSEVISLAYARQFLVDVVIARFSTVYGYTRFIPDTAFFEFIKKGCAGEDIMMNMSGLPRRDNIYIDDAVRGVLLIGSYGVTCEAYNISSNGDLENYASVDEIAQIIAKYTNVTLIFKSNNDGERMPGLRLNNNKLKGLGWECSVTLKNGILNTLRDFERYKMNDMNYLDTLK
jgi:nucleoside-diphosphate-sugar epimerase